MKKPSAKNRRRAECAMLALAYHKNNAKSCFDNLYDEDAVDLVANLLHWMHQTQIEGEAVIATAQKHFQYELRNPKE